MLNQMVYSSKCITYFDGGFGFCPRGLQKSADVNHVLKFTCTVLQVCLLDEPIRNKYVCSL